MKIEENSVELWSKEVKKRCNNALSEELNKALITLLLNHKQIDEDEEVKNALENSQSYLSVLYKRITYGGFTYTVTPSGLLFLEAMTHNFGISTMLCAFLQYMSYNLGVKEITINILAKDIFPFGIPSENDWNELQDMQKVRGEFPDNMLDHRVAYKSIIPSENS